MASFAYSSGACFADEAPISVTKYRDNALNAISALGESGKFSVPLGVLGPFSQWLGYPDWLREGTSLTGCGMLPQRISMADDITVTANFLDRGFGPELIRKTLQTKRLITGPTASMLIRNAPDLEQALIHLTSLIDATNMNVSLGFLAHEGRAEVNVTQKLPLGAMLDFVAAIRLILVMRTLEWFFLSNLQDVHLQLSLPHDPLIEEALREVSIDVEMGVVCNRIRFPSDWLNKQNADHDAALWRIGLQRLAEAKEARHSRNFAVRLRAMVTDHLKAEGKVLRLKELAAHEGVTVRTLARRLAASGLRFQDLVEDERRALVDRLILDTSLSLADIAKMSGYSNLSSFGRAFHQWHDLSPGAYRDAVIEQTGQ